jgi:hypothetical protein
VTGIEEGRRPVVGRVGDRGGGSTGYLRWRRRRRRAQETGGKDNHLSLPVIPRVHLECGGCDNGSDPFLIREPAIPVPESISTVASAGNSP